MSRCVFRICSAVGLRSLQHDQHHRTGAEPESGSRGRY
nr:MAG TPA: hypothetical protein [Caudoviricetes sp.]